MNNFNKAYTLNLLAASAIIMALLIAFYFEFILDDKPCPLCMLQRFGILAIGYGICLNLKNGISVQHYSIIILSAIFTMLIASRQILLHILPGDLGYGIELLGLHMYTWAFIFSVTMLLWSALALFYHPAKADMPYNTSSIRGNTKYNNVIFAAIILLTLVNAITQLL